MAEGSADDDWDGEASGDDEAEHRPGNDTEDQQTCRSGRGGCRSRGSLNNMYTLICQGTDEAASTMEVRKHTHRVSSQQDDQAVLQDSHNQCRWDYKRSRVGTTRLGGCKHMWSGAERRA